MENKSLFLVKKKLFHSGWPEKEHAFRRQDIGVRFNNGEDLCRGNTGGLTHNVNYR